MNTAYTMLAKICLSASGEALLAAGLMSLSAQPIARRFSLTSAGQCTFGNQIAKVASRSGDAGVGNADEPAQQSQSRSPWQVHQKSTVSYLHP